MANDDCGRRSWFLLLYRNHENGLKADQIGNHFADPIQLMRFRNHVACVSAWADAKVSAIVLISGIVQFSDRSSFQTPALLAVFSMPQRSPDVIATAIAVRPGADSCQLLNSIDFGDPSVVVPAPAIKIRQSQADQLMQRRSECQKMNLGATIEDRRAETRFCFQESERIDGNQRAQTVGGDDQDIIFFAVRSSIKLIEQRHVA
jgi:hypothetical protein